MAGRGKVGLEDEKSHQRVFALNENNKWVPAVEPIHFDKPEIVEVGPGLSFGKFIANSDESLQVGLIPCAFGQTSIKQWCKGEMLYETAIKRTLIAGKDGILKGILWHQGETDTLTKEDVDAYANRLVQLIEDIRSDIKMPEVPFVLSELGYFLEYCEPIIYRDPLDNFDPKFYNVVKEAIASIPARVTNCALVSSAGLEDKGDNIHFSAKSQRELGIRCGR